MSVSRLRVLRRALLVGLTMCAIAFWVVVVCVALCVGMARQGADFPLYYGAAAALRTHPVASIYDAQVIRAAVLRDGSCVLWPSAAYDYPPLPALALRPLSVLPCDVAFRVWTGMNSLLWVVDTALLLWWALGLSTSNSVTPSTPSGNSRIVGPVHHVRAWLQGKPNDKVALALVIVLLSALSYPLLASVVLGQINLVILCGVLAAPVLVRHGHPRLAGAVLALIALLKVYPALLVLYYALRRRWYVVAGAVASGALLVGGMMLAIGVASVTTTGRMLDNGFGFTHSATNEAFAQVPVWIAVLFGGRAGSATRMTGYALIGLVTLAFLTVVFAVSRRRPRAKWLWFGVPAYAPATPPGATHSEPPAAQSVSAETTEMLGYGWAVCAMLLISPLVWLHYFAWLLPPVAASLTVLMRTPPAVAVTRRRWWLAVLLGAYLCVAAPLPFSHDFSGVFATGPHLWGLPIGVAIGLARPLGTFTLWLLLGVLFVRETTRTQTLHSPRAYTEG